MKADHYDSFTLSYARPSQPLSYADAAFDDVVISPSCCTTWRTGPAPLAELRRGLRPHGGRGPAPAGSSF